MLLKALGFFKILVFAATVFLFLTVGAFLHFVVPDKSFRLRLLSQLTSFVCKFCLWGARVSTLTSGHSNLPEGPALIVANHMGMLDILMIASQRPCVFVTSYELKETPVVGWLTQVGGCVYVERRSRQNIHNEVKNIQGTLKSGLSVVVFPEAMSTNGDYVHPFKKSLFVSAAGTGVPVLPITINYLEVNQSPVTSQNRDQVCWYGDQPFHLALWRLMCNSSIKTELTFHPTLVMHTPEDRHLISQLAHQSVSSKFNSLNKPADQVASNIS